jgi:tetratricopeptide (TPR) repeat protein
MVAALLLRLLYLSTILNTPYFDHPITDEALYDTWARAIVAGRPFIEYPYYDSPLHAYFLALIYWIAGPDPLAVRLVQAVLGTLNVLLLYRTARRWIGPDTAKVAGVLAACYSPFLYYEGLLLKESVALFLMDGAVLLLMAALAHPRVLAFWSLGAVLGILALSRVNALLLAPACLLAAWIRGIRSPIPAAALLLGLVMVIAPVTVRNRLVSGEWVLLTVSGGQVLYTANNPATASGDLAPVPFVRATSAFERVDFHRRAEADTGRRLTPGEVSSYWRRQSLLFLLEHPATAARMVARRFLRFWNAVEMPDNHSIEQFKRFSWLLRLPLPGYWLVAPFALVGLFLLRSRWRELSGLYLIFGFYLVSLLPFWISSRYRLPVVGVMILFAAAAMTELRKRAHVEPRSRITLLGGLVTACLVCWWPMGRPDASVLERNLAYAYEQDRKYPEAIAIYERLRREQRNPENDLYLANALGLAGRHEEAGRLLRDLAGSERPLWVRQRALAFSGDLARRAKQWREAEQAYRAALALDATEYGSWNNLGVVLVNQERFREAEKAFLRAIALAPEDDLARRNLESLRQYLKNRDE